jgi:hypothetical protein
MIENGFIYICFHEFFQIITILIVYLSILYFVHYEYPVSGGKQTQKLQDVTWVPISQKPWCNYKQSICGNCFPNVRMNYFNLGYNFIKIQIYWDSREVLEEAQHLSFPSQIKSACRCSKYCPTYILLIRLLIILCTILPQQLGVINTWKGCLALVTLGGLLKCKCGLPCVSKLLHISDNTAEINYRGNRFPSTLLEIHGNKNHQTMASTLTLQSPVVL